MIDGAIDYYHSLLDGIFADEAREKLWDGIGRQRLTFGGRPICTVLRPLFITAQQYEYIKSESLLVLTAIQKLYGALLSDRRLRTQMGLSPDEEQLLAINPGFAAPDASGRLDAFLDTRGDFHFVEYNADSPGGLLYGDVLSEIFLGMEVVKHFAKRFPVRRVPIRPQLLHTLLFAYRQYGWQERPRIAIVDWREVSTYAEFEICRDYFTAQGYPTIIVDPQELDYRGGWLRAGDFRINLVYKRVVTDELLMRCGLQHPLLRAARDRAVCVVNSFHVQMLYKKMLFALLDDPAQAQLFTPAEHAALRRHIPWTRALREGKTTFHNRPVDLLKFVADNRARLVLKPNGEYGGRGVKLGWELTQEDWLQALRGALNESFVVQERVEVVQQIFPGVVDGEVIFAERYVDFDPYTWSGEEVEGAGVRLSSAALLNVTAGGGSATPLLLIDDAGQ